MAHLSPPTNVHARFHSVPTFEQQDEDDDGFKPQLAVRVSEKGKLPPQRHRRVLSLSVLGPAVVDICLAIAALYFVMFGTLAYRYQETPVKDNVVVFLLRAARLGPTILPIVFAGIVGRCLTAIAAWRLERGITIGAMEYLLGSRTVFSVVTPPIRLRTLHYLAPLLVLLCALSPLGGQANLRVISRTPQVDNSTASFSFLDSLSPLLADGASGWTDIGQVIWREGYETRKLCLVMFGRRTRLE
ncbi:hypothetical protein Slin15195_G045960 [Septoria linicola]|uniref:Uncharacterized protein n=1 Tax=Septoria linicola TaxID=215465 RepID=A0A9Q9AKV9_9PEZI|nr:hypothetical protein Slin14017_G049480 [Septoria linicola]USW51277.1 hypothetical protein Slin15195_G045960 [Septoria linicola]